MTKRTFVILAIFGCAMFASTVTAQTTRLKVDFTPTSPTGFSPLSVVFHDGTFNSFNAGDNLSGSGLELLAETGDNSQYLGSAPSTANVATNGANLAPGATTSVILDVDNSNTEFNFASMVLFSSDWFVGNQNGTVNVASLLGSGFGSSLVYDINTVYDADTETEDYTGVGGSGFFPFSTSGSLGVDITDGSAFALSRATNPYLNFTNNENLDLNGFDPTSLDAFTADSLGTITITVVPEPSTGLLALLGGCMALLHRRKS